MSLPSNWGRDHTMIDDPHLTTSPQQAQLTNLARHSTGNCLPSAIINYSDILPLPFPLSYTDTSKRRKLSPARNPLILVYITPYPYSFPLSKIRISLISWEIYCLDLPTAGPSCLNVVIIFRISFTLECLKILTGDIWYLWLQQTVCKI